MKVVDEEVDGWWMKVVEEVDEEEEAEGVEFYSTSHRNIIEMSWQSHVSIFADQASGRGGR